MKKYLAPVIGAAAFLIGGIIARDKALDGVATLEKHFHKDEPTPELPSE